MPESQYVHRLSEDVQALIQNNCVVVDRGRRDILFSFTRTATLVHQDDFATPNRIKTRIRREKLRRIRKRLKITTVVMTVKDQYKQRNSREAEQRLVNPRSYNTAEFTLSIKERSAVHDILRNHYASIMTNTNENQ